MNFPRTILSFLFVLSPNLPGLAQEQLPAIPAIERRIPPLGGIEFPEEEKKRLQHRVRDYADRLWEIEDHPQVGDIGALSKAVELALLHGEFYKKESLALASEILDMTDERFTEVVEKESHSWTEKKGLLVRGYQSKIDFSYQPFGLEIPENLDLSKPVPLLVWLHGRGDKITDLSFIKNCLTKSQALGGKVATQQDCIILHPFGRHCVGWKHAGETDVFEAIERVAHEYPIDREKIALAGFSMGGAGAWHIGAHYRDQFCAVHAGAGFAETALYNRLSPDTYPPEREQILWRVYDVPNYVRNFLNGPVLAYSGEEDKQKQAADVMIETARQEGFEIPHVIGKEMGHRYDDESVVKIWDFLKNSWAEGNDPFPKKIEWQGRTLRYSRHHWLQVSALEKHWEDSRVSASWDQGEKRISMQTKNVRALEITVPDDSNLAGYEIAIDESKITPEDPGFPVSSLSLIKSSQDGEWNWGLPETNSKRPGVQGPIDDAFLSHFVVVAPHEDPENPIVARWVNFELNHFRKRWRELLRGHLYEERAAMLDSSDIDDANLILWGDPSCNDMIAEIKDQLPVKNWTKDGFEFRGKQYDATQHVPSFIFPNPINPDRYIVINSGLTFREAHDRTNSLQNPKLPDWAIIGLDKLPDGESPGTIVDAGFFDENWE